MKNLYKFLLILITLIINNLLFSQNQWSKTNSAPSVNIYCLAQNNFFLFAGTQSGIYYSSDNGNVWALSGLTNVPVYTITSNSTHVFVGTNDGVKFSTNNGSSWTVINYGNNGLSYPEIKSLFVNGTNLYAGANGGYKIGGVFLSTNNATSWTSLSTGISDKNIQSLNAIGNNVFAGTANDGIYLTTNNGTLWTFAGLSNTSIYTLLPIGNNLYAGTPNGVYLSTNFGANWELKNSGLTMLTINAMIASGNNIFVGTPGGGVFLSTNSGFSWISVNTGLTEMNIKAFIIIGTNLYLATSSGNIWKRPLSDMVSGISIKNTIPKQWLSISGGTKNLNVSNIFQGNVGSLYYTAKSSNTLVATVSLNGSTLNITPISLGDCTITITATDAANSNSLDYTFDVNVGTTDIESEQIPTSFALFQNYPNPFNPTTKIRFALNKESFVTLKVYNIFGEEISTLLNNTISEGFHTINFDATNLASGIYIYKISLPGYTQSLKMMLLK